VRELYQLFLALMHTFSILTRTLEPSKAVRP
jgi:hypothetical protein